MNGPGGEEIRFGRVASPGLAAGPLCRLPAAVACPTSIGTGTPAEEIARLDRAVAAAVEALTALADGSADPEAAAILEFQIAVVEDDELVRPIRAAIAEGARAEAAWAGRLDAEIAGLGDGDDVFAARTSDLADLRDRVLGLLAGAAPVRPVLPDRAVVLARDLAPSTFLEIAWGPGHALALEEGSAASHVAVLARARALPMLVGLGSIDRADATPALLDAGTGRLILAPGPAAHAAHAARAATLGRGDAAAEARIREPAITADGRRIEVLINIAGPDDLAGLDPAICDGIGLTRSEFLLRGDGGRLPDEDEQLAAYARILAWAAGRRVVIRTLDAGGDKPVAGLTEVGERNPFLGLRGVRLSLARPEPFRIQLRALLRAAAAAPLDVMVPMVAVPAEIAAVRGLLAEEAAALAATGLAHAMPRLGMMAEVPSAALTLDRFAVDFVSIGSNDLTQYVMAAARDSAVPAVADLADAAGEPMLRLYRMIATAAAAAGLPLGLCGDVGADPERVGDLIGAGITGLSVAPGAVARIKAAIRRIGGETA